jgi:multidrug efflux pump subunit AcrA (membrane-fusion protein)
VGAPEDLTEAQYLGPAPSADPQFQGRGFLLLVKSDRLPPGTAVLAWLTVPGEKQSGVIVPHDALLRHEGGTFVYLQTADDTFRRQAVTLGRPDGNGWFVGQGFETQEQVVIVGAQQLLSEELRTQGGGE